MKDTNEELQKLQLKQAKKKEITQAVQGAFGLLFIGWLILLFI